MSRQTKFKIGDKVRRTSHLANGTHTYGTVDTVVGIKISWEKEWLNTKNNGSADCDADNYELVERAGEQRKDALGAMKMLEIIIIDLTNDLIKNKNPSFSEQTVEMMVDSFKQVRAALQSATISETQLESEIKKTAMSEKKATPVPSNINDNITITMDSKGRMLMKLKPEDEDTPMTDIDQLAQELEGKFYDVPAYDIRQILNYLHSHGYLGGVWQPIETALKDCCIDTFGTIQTHHGKKIKVRVTDDYMSSNSPYPLTTTYFEHPNGLTGTYTREAWMPLPKTPEVK